MSTHIKLRRAIQRITMATLAASPAVTGCGATDEPSVDRASFDLSTCADGKHGFATVAPGEPVDYFEVRELEKGTVNEERVILSMGTPCATATDVGECQRDLALKETEGWPGPVVLPFVRDIRRYLVWTRGDAVGAVRSLDELAKLMTPVDLSEAALLLSERGMHVLCDGNNARRVPGGFEILAQVGSTCGVNNSVRELTVFVDERGNSKVQRQVVIAKGTPCTVGRRPQELHVRETSVAAPTTLASFLSSVAMLEAASIPAFEQLARDLGAHDAPRALIARAFAAREDEVRHARMMRAIAETRGADVACPEVALNAPRPMLAIAIENAVEGCVRETFGALVAAIQARRAEDVDIREALREIAEDELNHAALAWDIAEWIGPRLSTADRAHVERARCEALATLRAELENEPEDDVMRCAGMPCARDAVAALDSLFSAFS